MKWNVIVNIGEADEFTPANSDEVPRITVPLERPSDAWRVTENLRAAFDDAGLAYPVGAARDLLQLGVAVYAADVRIRRAYGDDRWGRDLTVHLPVADPPRWQRSRSTLVELLNFLTGDSWQIEFRPRLEPARDVTPRASTPRIDVAALFSGGLDSLVGAIDLLASGKRVALVGHHGAGLTNSSQTRTLAELQRRFPDQIVPMLFGVQPRKNRRRGQAGDDDRRHREVGEPSMRGRSMLFFTLGVATAASFGPDTPLLAAENGLISLNVPLTGARQGSLSTRTTHPFVIDRLRALLGRLGLTTTIEMPYRFKTKGEMLSDCADQDTLALATPRTMSCSHPEAGRWAGKPGKHCGYCVPCVIRRAATTAAGVRDARYLIDPRKDAPPHTSAKGRDVRAFEIAVERYHASDRSDALAAVLSTGPIAAEDVSSFTDVYRRGMDEVAKFLRIKRATSKRGRL